jgi:hypothetical protein
MNIEVIPGSQQSSHSIPTTSTDPHGLTLGFLQCSLRLRDRDSNRVSDTHAFTLRPSRPAFVPRTTGRRQETTRMAGASNPQVRNQIRASPQVANPAPRTLSRWRHRFESRWDYSAAGVEAPSASAVGLRSGSPDQAKRRHFQPGTRPACLIHSCISGACASSRVFSFTYRDRSVLPRGGGGSNSAPPKNTTFTETS